MGYDVKKILLLGGSAQQVVAIETAKRMGYYTILCDYLSDNPGQYISDKFYQISTTDKEAVLAIALQEQIDGILAVFPVFGFADQSEPDIYGAVAQINGTFDFIHLIAVFPDCS